MIAILWSVLNLALLVSILYIFFRAAQLLKRHVSWGAALFFGFGLLTLVGSQTGNNQNEGVKNLITGVAPSTALGNGKSSHSTQMGINKLHIVAEYDNSNDTIAARGLYATVSGLMLGHTWKPSVGMLEQHDQQLVYSLAMGHDWHLLGMRVYSSEGIVLSGTMPIAKQLP